MPTSLSNEKDPIINCHTHIFTGKYVPPYLAKTFLPAPFYRLFKVSWIVRLLQYWYRGPYREQFGFKAKQKAKKKNSRYRWLKKTRIGYLVYRLIFWIFFIHVFIYLYRWLTFSFPSLSISWIEESIEWLYFKRFILLNIPVWTQQAIVVLAILYFKSIRNGLFWISKKLWGFLSSLPGKETKELADRYLLLGRFALYEKQTKVFSRLVQQFSMGTHFVILPMDMEYMGAGSLPDEATYDHQMDEILEVMAGSNGFAAIPFIFIDPRRIKSDPDFFRYYPTGHQVRLQDCKVKRWLDQGFRGFKIYPALGYYPFDEALLPLWKYAAEHQIPIMTHCIRGTIYYRGKKEPSWDFHPVIEQAKTEMDYEPLGLFQRKNSEFTLNFTHPLNYLCLVEEPLLRKVIAKSKDEKLRALFGFTNEKTALKENLKDLKICLAHFGGEEQWEDFLESDRDNYSHQLIKNPHRGIDFFKNERGDDRPGKLEQLWRTCDWYSIIVSLILQYPNIYADLSYILHNESILPLLIENLQPQHDKLRSRILFGTDFYVVRNHKTEKNLWIDIQSALGVEAFDLIARENPKRYLNRT